MIVDILALSFVILLLLTVCASVAGARTTPTTTVAAPAAPATAAHKMKDSRPLWAQAPMADSIPPRCSAWENQWASLDARLEREAQLGKAAKEEMEADRRMRARLEREKQERLAFDREWEARNNRRPEKKPWWANTHLKD